MRVHHDKHHQAYVDERERRARGHRVGRPAGRGDRPNLDAIPEDKRAAVRNNAGGHVNHSLFWQLMSPDGGGEPGGALARRDLERVRRSRRAQGRGQRRRREALRQRLDVARARRRLARGDVDAEPGLAADGGQDAAARHRRLGARLLPQVPEPPPGLPRGLVERRQLGRGAAPLRRPPDGSCACARGRAGHWPAWSSPVRSRTAAGARGSAGRRSPLADLRPGRAPRRARGGRARRRERRRARRGRRAGRVLPIALGIRRRRPHRLVAGAREPRRQAHGRDGVHVVPRRAHDRELVARLLARPAARRDRVRVPAAPLPRVPDRPAALAARPSPSWCSPTST